MDSLMLFSSSEKVSEGGERWVASREKGPIIWARAGMEMRERDFSSSLASRFVMR